MYMMFMVKETVVETKAMSLKQAFSLTQVKENSIYIYQNYQIIIELISNMNNYIKFNQQNADCYEQNLINIHFYILYFHYHCFD